MSWDDATRQRCYRALLAGETLAEITAREGVCKDTLTGWRQRIGAPVPIRGRIPRDEWPHIATARAAGKGYDAIAKAYGCSPSQIRNIVIRMAEEATIRPTLMHLGDTGPLPKRRCGCGRITDQRVCACGDVWAVAA